MAIPIETQIGGYTSETQNKFERLSPAAQKVLESADKLLQSHEVRKGEYGFLHTDPGIVTLIVTVNHSAYDREWMYDIGITVLPHAGSGVTPEDFNGSYVALNEGAVPSKNDLWRLVPITTEGNAGFSIVPRKAVSKMRIVFPEERERLKRQRAQKSISKPTS